MTSKIWIAWVQTAAVLYYFFFLFEVSPCNMAISWRNTDVSCTRTMLTVCIVIAEILSQIQISTYFSYILIQPILFIHDFRSHSWSSFMILLVNLIIKYLDQLLFRSDASLSNFSSIISVIVLFLKLIGHNFFPRGTTQTVLILISTSTWFVLLSMILKK